MLWAGCCWVSSGAASTGATGEGSSAQPVPAVSQELRGAQQHHSALGEELCATEQEAFGTTAHFFLQKLIDFVTGLAAFLCTWILASPVEEFVVSKTLITLV